MGPGEGGTAREESDALHARVRAVIRAFERGESSPEAFDAIAADLARFQVRHVPGYARLCAARGVDPGLHRRCRGRACRTDGRLQARGRVRLRRSRFAGDLPHQRHDPRSARRARLPRRRHVRRRGARVRARDARSRPRAARRGPRRRASAQRGAGLVARPHVRALRPRPRPRPARGASVLRPRRNARHGRPARACGDAGAVEPRHRPRDQLRARSPDRRDRRRGAGVAGGSRIMQTGGFKGRSREVAPAICGGPWRVSSGSPRAPSWASTA